MDLEGSFNLIFSSLCSLIISIYVLIIASILAAKGAFNDNNTKNNYNKKYSKIIDKINYSFFGFLAYIIISYIFLFIWTNIRPKFDYGITKIMKKILLIFFGIIHILYEAIIIVKLYLSYKIKKKVTWFMICDYILIIFIFIYIALVVKCTFDYFRIAGKKIIIKKEVYLTKFRGIKIVDYELPDDFNKMEKKERKKYILENKNNYKITFSTDDKMLIGLINKLREVNNIDELIFDREIFFKDLIIDKYAEPIFSENKEIFKISDTNFLFKFPVGVFKKRLYNF